MAYVPTAEHLELDEGADRAEAVGWDEGYAAGRADRPTRVYRIVPNVTLRLIFAALLGIASLQLTTLAVLAWATCALGCGR